MTLRSKQEQKVKKNVVADVKTLPFITYSGKMHYYTTLIDCAMHCDTLLNKAKQCQGDFVIGFDMEWPFSFVTGSGKTALLQLSISLEECYLFQVSEFRNLPKSLIELLSYEKVKLVGVNIKNDINKLYRDFSVFNKERALANCIDLRPRAKKLNTGYMESYSLENLVNSFLGLQINKNKKVRQSKWNVIPLTQAQQEYAVIDAFAGLKLHHHFKVLEEENAENVNMQ